MKHAAIPVDLFNKLVEYLQTRPYTEVAQAIEEIRTSVKVIDLDEEKPEETPDE